MLGIKIADTIISSIFNEPRIALSHTSAVVMLRREFNAVSTLENDFEVIFLRRSPVSRLLLVGTRQDKVQLHVRIITVKLQYILCRYGVESCCTSCR